MKSAGWMMLLPLFVLVGCRPPRPPVAPVTGTANAPVALVAGDWNGDGIVDLAATARLDNAVTIFLGNGDGTFEISGQLAVGDDPRGIAAGDLDENGYLDLVVTAIGYYDPEDVRVFLGDGQGGFVAGDVLTSFTNPRNVVIVDYDGDSHLDALVTNDEGQVSVLQGNGTGTLAYNGEIPTREFPWGLVAQHLDGDDTIDVVTTDRDSGTLSVTTAGGTRTIDVGAMPRPVVAADLNADGTLDLVVGREHELELLIGAGDGTFSASSQGLGSGEVPFSIGVIDLDGDGRVDIATANHVSDNISVLFGRGDGTFEDPRLFPAGNAPFTLVVADFDGDARPDIAVTNMLDDTLSLFISANWSWR